VLILTHPPRSICRPKAPVGELLKDANINIRVKGTGLAVRVAIRAPLVFRLIRDDLATPEP
jgi:hypothetical protein